MHDHPGINAHMQACRGADMCIMCLVIRPNTIRRKKIVLTQRHMDGSIGRTKTDLFIANIFTMASDPAGPMPLFSSPSALIA